MYGVGAIRLIALVAARYGTGSGSDPRAIDPVATAPGTVPERSFLYIQLKSALISRSFQQLFQAQGEVAFDGKQIK